VDGPFLVESVLRLAKRQSFPKSCFIDLDNLHKITKRGKVRIPLCRLIAIADIVIRIEGKKIRRKKLTWIPAASKSSTSFLMARAI